MSNSVPNLLVIIPSETLGFWEIIESVFRNKKGFIFTNYGLRKAYLHGLVAMGFDSGGDTLRDFQSKSESINGSENSITAPENLHRIAARNAAPTVTAIAATKMLPPRGSISAKVATK